MATVLITGHASVETAVQALELDAEAYITKPLDMDEVMRTLDNVLIRQRLLKEKLEAESALKESESRYRDLFTLSPISIREEDWQAVGAWMESLKENGITNLEDYLSNHPGEIKEAISLIKVQNVNKATLDMFEAESFEQLKNNFEKIFDEDAYDIFKEELVAIWNNNPDGISIEYNGITLKENRFDNITILKAPLVNGKLDLSRVIVAIADITQQKKAEEEVRTLNEELAERVKERTSELEATNKELESFSYSVSHDLRGPLRSINGFSKALLEDYYDLLDDEGRDYLGRLQSAAVQMGELIDGMLVLSRVTRKDLRNEEVDLSQIAHSIEYDLKHISPNRSVDFVIAENITVNGDERLLRLVLENLLSNSWKFTATRNTARIEFGKLVDEGRTVFFVNDNGVGFDMTYIDKLFGPFQRLHHADDFEGAGIGLATVRRIISRHGGQVWAEGEVDKGATFYFTLKEEIS
jgi:signal transduction histidine kinase